ncbi:fungal-specific transcription factor domain-containing protein [Macrophomina phaseolina]|uniref:Fungal-specific transcription factor domain-containing protein n=1 Tax=Macrophomina phaseolina TaxID=35725 RepID=A0ABQ8GEA7_9PEZI|nr:fungal-specific transcription factor domain-containing protein [Macrophomina phaseolina]
MPPTTQPPSGESATHPPSDQQRARKRPKIRRTTFACARCHRRKIKCDGLKPACSNCVQAKQPCNGILDGESKTVIPRSIAQYLQEKIQEKELLLRKLGVDPDSDNAPQVVNLYAGNSGGLAAPSPALAEQQLDVNRPHFDLATETARSFSVALSRELLVSHIRFPYGTFLFASSHLPSVTPAPVESDIREDYFKPKNTSNPLEQIPRDVTERLVRNYVERISPLYPYFDRQELWTRYNRVSSAQRLGDNSASQHDVFVVSMMIAISIMTSKASDSAKVASSSERIFQHALNHADALYETSFQSLQGTLLLIQYSYLMPRAASLWDIVGLAMRMALELGLHRDPEEVAGYTLTDSEMELRRCVFWVLYIFDRSICATSHRRLGVADESISTKYPSGMDGTYFLNNILFRRIQSELWTVNYLRRGLPLLKDEGSYAAWVDDIEHRMQSWRSGVTKRRSDSPEWYDIAVWHGFVFLHRPCPRNPFPPAESLIKCFEAATEVAAGYWENAHSGFLKYSWHAVHHGFEAAMAMLYALRHCKTQLKERHGTRKILETVHLFSSLFVLMSERWSQAHASLESYERCKTTVMRELMQQGSPASPGENDELHRMILPQQAQVEKGGRVKREREIDKSESSTPASATTSTEVTGRLQKKRSFIDTHLSVPVERIPVRGSESEPNSTTESSPQPPSVANLSHAPQLPLAPSSHVSWPAPPMAQLSHLQQQRQPGVFAAVAGPVPVPVQVQVPVPEYQNFHAGHDMWTTPGQSTATTHTSMDWEDMVMQPDQTGIDGMMLWSM